MEVFIFSELHTALTHYFRLLDVTILSFFVMGFYWCICVFWGRVGGEGGGPQTVFYPCLYVQGFTYCSMPYCDTKASMVDLET